MASSVINKMPILPTNNLNYSNFNDIPSGMLGWVNQSIQNSPMGSSFAGHIFTYKPFTTHGFQIALRFNADALYVRVMVDGEWRSWKEITMS